MGFIPKPWFSSCNREKSSFRKAKYIIYYIHIYHKYLSRFKTYENICFLEACAVGVRSGGTVSWVQGTMGGYMVGTVDGNSGCSGGCAGVQGEGGSTVQGRRREVYITSSS